MNFIFFNLLILEGTFSDDIITTGMFLRDEDSCTKKMVISHHYHKLQIFSIKLNLESAQNFSERLDLGREMKEDVGKITRLQTQSYNVPKETLLAAGERNNCQERKNDVKVEKICNKQINQKEKKGQKE